MRKISELRFLTPSLKRGSLSLLLIAVAAGLFQACASKEQVPQWADALRFQDDGRYQEATIVFEQLAARGDFQAVEAIIHLYDPIENKLPNPEKYMQNLMRAATWLGTPDVGARDYGRNNHASPIAAYQCQVATAFLVGQDKMRDRSGKEVVRYPVARNVERACYWFEKPLSRGYANDKGTTGNIVRNCPDLVAKYALGRTEITVTTGNTAARKENVAERVNQSARDQRWVPFSKDREDVITYVNPSAIDRTGDRVKILEMSDYDSESTGFWGGTFRSVLLNMEYDCGKRTMRVVGRRWFSGRMGGGKVVKDDDEISDWLPLRSFEAKFALACTQNSEAGIQQETGGPHGKMDRQDFERLQRKWGNSPEARAWREQRDREDAESDRQYQEMMRQEEQNQAAMLGQAAGILGQALLNKGGTAPGFAPQMPAGSSAGGYHNMQGTFGAIQGGMTGNRHVDEAIEHVREAIRAGRQEDAAALVQHSKTAEQHLREAVSATPYENNSDGTGYSERSINWHNNVTEAQRHIDPPAIHYGQSILTMRKDDSNRPDYFQAALKELNKTLGYLLATR